MRRRVPVQLLVVEDDGGTGKAFVDTLITRGYCVNRTRRENGEYDCVVVDMDLPDEDSPQLLRHLRSVSSAPMVVLIADGNTPDVAQAMLSGTERYSTKPPRTGELAARLDTPGRGVSQIAGVVATEVITNDVRVDLVADSVEVAGDVLPLTRKEFELVRTLVETPGIAVSRQLLMERIWGDDFITVSRCLDVHMSSLRAKINRPGLITTIRGYGYRWGPQHVGPQQPRSTRDADR